jgi:uncharacterized membrane protein
MLVHAPIGCWIITPICDALALTLQHDAFWHAGAIITAFGVLFGALAATAGAMDMPRAKTKAPTLVLVHATLMALAWALSTASLFGRVSADYSAVTPAPIWAIAASAIALALMLAGAWCGGEMVYGRGVGVRDEPS